MRAIEVGLMTLCCSQDAMEEHGDQGPPRTLWRSTVIRGSDRGITGQQCCPVVPRSDPLYLEHGARSSRRWTITKTICAEDLADEFLHEDFDGLPRGGE